MTERDVIVGMFFTAFVLGGYFLGVVEGVRSPSMWREFFRSLVRGIRLKGFLGAAALPLIWLMLFYGLVLLTRFSLGKWPSFGQQLPGQLLPALQSVVMFFATMQIFSLWLVPVLFVGFLFWPKRRHFSAYTLTYVSAMAGAIGLMYLAPKPFLNWFFD